MLENLHSKRGIWEPDWLKEQREILSKTLIVLPVGVKPPTVEEVAMQQLKKAREPVQPGNPTTEEVAMQQLVDDVQKDIMENYKTNFPYEFENAESIGVNGINRIIEKVKQIEDEV